MGFGQAGYLFSGSGGGSGTPQWVVEYDHSCLSDGTNAWAAASSTPFTTVDSSGVPWYIFGSGASGTIAFGTSPIDGWFLTGAAVGADRFYVRVASFADMAAVGGGPAFNLDTDVCFIVVDATALSLSNFGLVAFDTGLAQPTWPSSGSAFAVSSFQRRNTSGTQEHGYYGTPITQIANVAYTVGTFTFAQSLLRNYVRVNQGSISTSDPALVGPMGMGTDAPANTPILTGRSMTPASNNISTYTKPYLQINYSTGASGGSHTIKLSRIRFLRWRVP
jgi:hypothetical protein